MSTHDAENHGAKPRDHAHPRHHILKHAHKDWRVWAAALLMLALILAYVFTDNLSLQPGGKSAAQPTPAQPAP